jgi:hypothetical protein
VERRAANTHATDLVKLCDNRHQTVLSFAQQKQLALRYRFYHPTGSIGKIANVMVTQNRNFFFRKNSVSCIIGGLTIVFLTMACTSVCFFGFELQPTKKKYK